MMMSLSYVEVTLIIMNYFPYVIKLTIILTSSFNLYFQLKTCKIGVLVNILHVSSKKKKKIKECFILPSFEVFLL